MPLGDEKRSQLWSKALKEVYFGNKSETTTYKPMSDEKSDEEIYDKKAEEMCTNFNKECDSKLNDFEEQNFGSKTIRISNNSSKELDEDSDEEISVKKAKKTYTLDKKGCDSGLKNVEEQNFGSKTEVIANKSSKELDEDSDEEISVKQHEEMYALEKKRCDLEEDINIKHRIHVGKPCKNKKIDDFEFEKHPYCVNNFQNIFKIHNQNQLRLQSNFFCVITY